MTTQIKMTRLHTTVGELIKAIRDAAMGFTSHKRNAYRLTGLITNHMMLHRVPVAATRHLKFPR
ncbi:MAG TPA: hypothetical protein VE131_01570 [Terriglobales bacterium]|nr:hypothetical protein [Terriglobales bacterium]